MKLWSSTYTDINFSKNKFPIIPNSFSLKYFMCNYVFGEKKNWQFVGNFEKPKFSPYVYTKYDIKKRPLKYWIITTYSHTHFWAPLGFIYKISKFSNIIIGIFKFPLPNKKKLTGGNWQKWKRVFLTCPCHEIYRDEAVGLKSCKNTWKITIFVKMWNLGQYRENLIFCQ